MKQISTIYLEVKLQFQNAAEAYDCHHPLSLMQRELTKANAIFSDRWQKVKQWALNGAAREVVRTQAIRQACTADPYSIVERV